MSNLLPKISIITPSFNQGEFLERTILSILDQNYPNLEYIIIDGGSTDHSIEIIKKYEKRISYWISEKDKGTYEANNKGLEKMRGQFWCVVNSDDILLSGALDKIANAILQNPNQKWFVGGVQYLDEEDTFLGREMPIRPESIEGHTFLNGCWISHPTVFLSREVFLNVGYFQKYHLMDLNYWLRMENKGYSPMILNDYVAGLRIHKNRKSADLIKLQEEFLKVYNEFVKDYGISTSKSVIKNSKSHKIYFLKLKISVHLLKGNRLKVVELLFKAFQTTTNVLFEKWYWGAIKRLIFGVSKNDKLFELFSMEDSKANWNNLDN